MEKELFNYSQKAEYDDSMVYFLQRVLMSLVSGALALQNNELFVWINQALSDQIQTFLSWFQK
jgi:hypothetical protein